MKNYKRSARIAELIRVKVCEILAKKINDPRISSITITNVDVSDDLRNAKIFYSLMGTKEEEKQTVDSFKKATNYIKSMIGHELGLRYVPKIQFLIDDKFREGINVLDLIETIKEDDE